MNIVVMLKQTPDTESVIRIASNGKSIVTDDLKWIINPYDEFALEAALRLREQHGGKVTLVSYGPQRVVEAIRTALAMGADDAVLIDDPLLADGDLLGAVRAMATVVQDLNPDIICCGARAVDYDQAQRGAMMAEFLGWPHLALAVSLQSDGTKVTIERPIEGGIVTLEATLPALVTFGGSHSIWNPRYASLPGIMKAKKKPLATKIIDRPRSQSRGIWREFRQDPHHGVGTAPAKVPRTHHRWRPGYRRQGESVASRAARRSEGDLGEGGCHGKVCVRNHRIPRREVSPCFL